MPCPNNVLPIVFAITTSVVVAQQQYPEGSPIPRSLTELEQAWIARNPISVPEVVTPPPAGPVRCVAEYEAMEGIVVAWEGSASWLTILAKISRHVTTTGQGRVWIAVDSAAEATSARNRCASEGANMARVSTVVVSTNTIWLRDYGPRYIYQGECRAVVDHTYNRPRPQDNAFNSFYAPYRGHALYELGLVHGGGNYHLDGVGRSRATRLINNENPSLSEQQIHDIWERYQNVSTRFYQPFPRSVDSTQHIDMWMQVIADDAVVISDWPFNSGSAQDVICDNAAQSMAAEGYRVFRVPARSVGGTHYTYTNVVLCNDLVLIPSYTNSQVSQHNSQALGAWRSAMPTKTVVQVNCQAIVTSAGVMHCIVMHVPAHLGGVDPTALLTTPNGGEVLTPGQKVGVRWVSDDDEGVVSVDLMLSIDGGATYPTTLATQLPRNGEWVWDVPALCSGKSRIRVVARDAQGRTGSDQSDADFGISGAGCGAGIVIYGAGSAGQLGTPTLTSSPPVIPGPLNLSLANAWPGAAAGIFVGAAPASLPFQGGTMLVQPVVAVPVVIQATGNAALSLSIPAVTGWSGASIYWQGWIVGDPGSASGFASTAGLQTVFGF